VTKTRSWSYTPGYARGKAYKWKSVTGPARGGRIDWRNAVAVPPMPWEEGSPMKKKRGKKKPC